MRLVAAPARQFLNSTFTETPTARKREGRPQALIAPEDGALFGVADGALMRLGNERGEVVLHARYVPGQRRHGGRGKHLAGRGVRRRAARHQRADERRAGAARRGRRVP